MAWSDDETDRAVAMRSGLRHAMDTVNASSLISTGIERERERDIACKWMWREMLMTRFYSVVTFHSVFRADTKEAEKERKKERKSQMKRDASREEEGERRQRARENTSRIRQWVNQQTKRPSLQSTCRLHDEASSVSLTLSLSLSAVPVSSEYLHQAKRVRDK